VSNPKSALAGDPGPLGAYSDAARRVSDAMTMHLTVDAAHAVNKWMAFRLSDGGTDNVLYDDPFEAADRQLHYRQCMYLQVKFGSISPRDASIMLTYYRQVYDAGNVPPALKAYHAAKLMKGMTR
jgi:hypothetical protein